MEMRFCTLASRGPSRLPSEPAKRLIFSPTMRQRASGTRVGYRTFSNWMQSNVIEFNRTIEFDCWTQLNKIKLTKKLANQTQSNVRFPNFWLHSWNINCLDRFYKKNLPCWPTRDSHVRSGYLYILGWHGPLIWWTKSWNKNIRKK